MEPGNLLLPVTVYCIFSFPEYVAVHEGDSSATPNRLTQTYMVNITSCSILVPSFSILYYIAYLSIKFNFKYSL